MRVKKPFSMQRFLNAQEAMARIGFVQDGLDHPGDSVRGSGDR
jgi:hypothetical protein